MLILKRSVFFICVVFLVLALGYGWLQVSVSEKQVEFQSNNLVLSGTLLSPRWNDAAPAIVLVSGSGPATRQSMIVYAWLFAIKGYATLAYDKRGVGASDGLPHEWREFSFVDLAADAAAAYNFLQLDPRIDQNKVGFFGASQGGWVVSLAANHVKSPAFAIMTSASVSTVAEDRIFGREAKIRYAGFDEVAVTEASNLIQADQLVTRTRSGHENYLQLWNSHRNRDWFKEVYGDELPEAENSPYRQWERTILDFDPLPLLKRLDIPVLWIFGDPKLDRSSPVSLSVDRVSAAKAAGGCYRLIQIDGVGHTLEPDRRGSLTTRLKARISLVSDFYEWLDDLGIGNSCQH
jgi:pimeloyl-ACP methyl ester carboxylesterase